MIEKDLELVNALARHFYDVVPPDYKTYCSLTSRISQAVLQRFGLTAELVACQVWLVTEDHNFVVGFLGKSSPGKWDGHVVCKTGSVIIDAALKHFEKEFGLQVPNVITSRCFDVPTQVISRCNLRPTACFWWHYPPASPFVDPCIPEEPDDTIARYAAALTEYLSTRSSGEVDPPRPRTATDASQG